jgi:hypothetical protein
MGTIEPLYEVSQVKIRDVDVVGDEYFNYFVKGRYSSRWVPEWELFDTPEKAAQAARHEVLINLVDLQRRLDRRISELKTPGYVEKTEVVHLNGDSEYVEI